MPWTEMWNLRQLQKLTVPKDVAISLTLLARLQSLHAAFYNQKNCLTPF